MWVANMWTKHRTYCSAKRLHEDQALSLHNSKHLIGLPEYPKMNARLDANGAMIANPKSTMKEYYKRHGTLCLQNVYKVVLQACLYMFVKVFVCITSHSCDCCMAGSGRTPLQTAE